MNLRMTPTTDTIPGMDFRVTSGPYGTPPWWASRERWHQRGRRESPLGRRDEVRLYVTPRLTWRGVLALRVMPLATRALFACARTLGMTVELDIVRAR